MPLQHNTNRFSLKDFRITNVGFTANERYRAGKGKTVEINTKISLDSSYDENTKVLSLSIGLRQVNEQAPFTYDVRGAGEFKFEDAPDDNTVERLSKINCPAILFPYMRELVADLTRRGGFPALHLAPVNFVALAEAAESEEVAAPKRKPRAKKKSGS